ncbi:MAG: hypothetical protein LBP83_04315 [Dysgonamonadaceae bacterium]|jgi:hypothetical protein|nr:hypothetical protein [Dysgonamonadaceae bacterium]
MSFINEIVDYRSVSIVGMAKNTGKTECLNYILNHIKNEGKLFAVTSIGVDGERIDRVTQSAKPEIEISEGMFFVTSEKHYREKQLTAEIIDVSENYTALGRLVTAKAVTAGKILLSGPSDTRSLKELIVKMKQRGVHTTLVDGAISRFSLGSPGVTEALILTTGAALSKSIPELVRKTKYVYDLIQSEVTDQKLSDRLSGIEKGIWAIDKEGEIHDLQISSVLSEEFGKEDIFRYGNIIFVAGIVSDNFLRFLRIQKHNPNITLIVKDFTRIFASSESYYAFLKNGGKLKVALKNKFIGVCINPQSPDGYQLDSVRLSEALQESLKIPVYDIKQM